MASMQIEEDTEIQTHDSGKDAIHHPLCDIIAKLFVDYFDSSPAQTPSFSEHAVDIRLATATAVFDLILPLGSKALDMRALAQSLPYNGIVYDPAGRAFKGTSRKGGFANAVELRLRSSGRLVCVFIFDNGKVKISGATSEAAITKTTHELTSTLVHRRLCSGFRNLRVVMCKYDCNLGRAICLSGLHAYMSNFVPCVYDPARYNGLQV